MDIFQKNILTDLLHFSVIVDAWFISYFLGLVQIHWVAFMKINSDPYMCLIILDADTILSQSAQMYSVDFVNGDNDQAASNSLET